MISVATVRDYVVDGKVVLPENAVYVGRAVKRWGLRESVLANPYKIGSWNPFSSCRITRAGAIELYRNNFLGDAETDSRDRAPWIRDELARLRALATQGELTLVCHCVTWDGTGEAPGKCHAEVIKAVLEADDAKG